MAYLHSNISCLTVIFLLLTKVFILPRVDTFFIFIDFMEGGEVEFDPIDKHR